MYALSRREFVWRRGSRGLVPLRGSSMAVRRVQVELPADGLVGQPRAEVLWYWRSTEREDGLQSCPTTGLRARGIALNPPEGQIRVNQALRRSEVPGVARLEVGTAVRSVALVGGDPDRAGHCRQRQNDHEGDCIGHTSSRFLFVESHVMRRAICIL